MPEPPGDVAELNTSGEELRRKRVAKILGRSRAFLMIRQRTEKLTAASKPWHRGG
jgi:hypothetical protein